MLSIIPYYIIAAAVILAVIWAKRELYDQECEYEARIRASDAKGRVLAGKLESLKVAEEETRSREDSTVGLYEITRDMSAQLKFSDIFRVFSSFLKSNFSFKKLESFCLPFNILWNSTFIDLL